MTAVIDNNKTTEWYEQLWQDLRKGMFAMQQTITTIIAEKAWEPLGYDSFTEAWSARLADVTLGSELRAHVVFQMFREGSTPEEVAAAMKGVGRDSADAFKSQMENGVPAELATGRSRTNTEPLPFVTVFVPVPREAHRAWKRVAKRNKVTLAEVALAALNEAIEAME